MAQFKPSKLTEKHPCFSVDFLDKTVCPPLATKKHRSKAQKKPPKDICPWGALYVYSLIIKSNVIVFKPIYIAHTSKTFGFLIVFKVGFVIVVFVRNLNNVIFVLPVKL